MHSRLCPLGSAGKNRYFVFMRGKFLVGFATFLVSIVLPFALKAQVKKLVFNTSLTANMFLHTYGAGTGIDFFRKTGDKEFLFSADISSFKNKREQKIESVYKNQNGKDFIFDKKNYFYSLSAKAGFAWKIAGLSHFNMIEARCFVQLGPSLGFLKPYYVEIAVPITQTQADVIPEKYDASKFSYYDIVGEADYFLGMDEISIVPGFSATAGMIFDFDGQAEFIKAIKISANADCYPSQPEILDTQINRKYFIGGTFALVFGNSWEAGGR